MGTLKVTLVTGRTISQGITREGKKKLREYMESVAVCELDPEDMGKLGVKEGTPIRVKTSYGTVVVSTKVSSQAPHPSIAFIPMGPWANEVIGQDTDSIGMPTFKGVEAEIEVAPSEKISDVLSLIKGRI